jgi:hypothetical protein
MSEELDIRSLSVSAAAKLLKVQAKTVRAHIRRGPPLVDGRIDLIVYRAWLNREVLKRDIFEAKRRYAADSGASPQDGT